MSLLCFGFSRPRPYDNIPLCGTSPSLKWTCPHTLTSTINPVSAGSAIPTSSNSRCPSQLPSASASKVSDSEGRSLGGPERNGDPSSRPVGLSPWGSSSVPALAPSSTCHPPAAGRSPQCPQQSHPPPGLALALHVAARSPVPVSDKWQEGRPRQPQTLVGMSALLPGILPSSLWAFFVVLFCFDFFVFSV